MRLLLCLLTLTFLADLKMESRMFAQGAAQEDRKRIAARCADEEGERLRKQGTAKSLRKAINK